MTTSVRRAWAPGAEEFSFRTKRVQTSISTRRRLAPFSYLAMPILSSCLLVAISLLVYFLCIAPLLECSMSDTDSVIIDIDDAEPIIKPSAILPPFDQQPEEPSNIKGKLKLIVDCDTE